MLWIVNCNDPHQILLIFFGLFAYLIWLRDFVKILVKNTTELCQIVLVGFCIQCTAGMLMQEHRLKRVKSFMTSQGQGNS